MLSVVRGETSVKEAARRSGVSETLIAKWRDQFLIGGSEALKAATDPHKKSSREAELEHQVADLTHALGEAHVELRVLKRGGPAGFPSPNWS